MRLLCVCLGNICRSPMAEGALRALAARAGLAITVESAGTGAYHIGNPPDSRGLTVAKARGYDNSGQRARQIEAADFGRFDMMLAMDRQNLRDLERLRPEGSPVEIRLFHPQAREIPDPYYGDLRDYDHALDLIEESARALVADLAARA